MQAVRASEECFDVFLVVRHHCLPHGEEHHNKDRHEADRHFMPGLESLFEIFIPADLVIDPGEDDEGCEDGDRVQDKSHIDFVRPKEDVEKHNRCGDAEGEIEVDFHRAVSVFRVFC